MKLTLIAAMLAATALLAGCNDAGPAKPETTKRQAAVAVKSGYRTLNSREWLHTRKIMMI